MIPELEEHEIDLITLLRLCEPHDEVRIVVENGTWTVLVEKSKRIVFDLKVAKK